MIREEQLAAELQLAGWKVTPPPPPPPVDKCYVCGKTEGDCWTYFGYGLTDVFIRVAMSEEGDSEIDGHLCGEHLEKFQDAMQAARLVVHHHGSTTLLEDRECIGSREYGKCPNPTDRSGEPLDEKDM